MLARPDDIQPEATLVDYVEQLETREICHVTTTPRRAVTGVVTHGVGMDR